MPRVLSVTPFHHTFFGLELTSNPIGRLIVFAFYAILLSVLIFRSLSVSFPRDIREAALMDGLGEWRPLLQTILPKLPRVSPLIGLAPWSLSVAARGKGRGQNVTFGASAHIT